MFSRRMQMQMRLQQLRQRREPHLAVWREITQYLCPFLGNYDNNRDAQAPDFTSIIDETGTQALEVMAAGMMSLRTSPARPWFRFQTPDHKLNKRHAARRWLFGLQMMVQDVCRKSNTYRMLPQHYTETGAVGTGVAITVDDADNVVHHYQLTAGEYCIALDARGRPDTVYREFSMTAIELVKEFGIQNVSKEVRDLIKNAQHDALVKVIHVIEPRADRDPWKRDAANMPWASVYYEAESFDENQILREGGFQEFPCLVSRWQTIGTNTWGIGLGHKALGSVRQLHVEQLAKARAIEHQGHPPVIVPTSLKDRDRDLMPGGIIPYDQTTPYGGIRTAYEVPLRIDHMQLDIDDVRRRINGSFHVNLFQTLASLNDSTARTAAEIMSRREETLTLLGPVTQNLQADLDEPLLTGIVNRLIRAGAVPPAPPELQGMPLEIEHIGPLAQALKAVAAQSLDRFTTSLGFIANMKPAALDRFDEDAWVDIYSDMWNVDPDLIVPGPKAALIRDARNKALAAKEQSSMMVEQAKAARDFAAAAPPAPGAGAPIDPARGYATGGI